MGDKTIVLDRSKGSSTTTAINTNEDVLNILIATAKSWDSVKLIMQHLVGTNIVKAWVYILKKGGTDPVPSDTTDDAFANSDGQLLEAGKTASGFTVIENLSLEDGDRLKVKIRSGGTAPAAGAYKVTASAYGIFTEA